jgi:hypothetical protein
LSHPSIETGSGANPISYAISSVEVSIRGVKPTAQLQLMATSRSRDLPLLSIISGSDNTICSKINFGPTGHHQPLPCVCVVPIASVICIAPWKSCSVRVFITAGDFTSTVSKWRILPYKHPCTAHAFFPELLSNHCQCLRRTCSEICIKSDAHALSDPSENRGRPDTRLHIKGHKSRRVHRCVRFCTLTPRMC